MNIVFYLHSPATYQFDFFLSLIKKKIKVNVIYQNKRIANFNWKFKNYKWVHFLDKNNPPSKIEKVLKKTKPNAVIIGGYKMNNESVFQNNKNFLILYWLEKLEKKFFIKSFIRFIILKKKLSNVDGILAIGNQAKSYYKKFHDNVINLPYSIKNVNYDLSKKKYNLNFLFVGQLINRKGLDFLIDTIIKIKSKKYKFTVVGEGNLKLKLNKIKNVDFNHYNFLNKKKLSSIYKKNSILIVPSRFDGWAVVVIEAMLNGLAIISNKNVGAFKEYIKHGINGREAKLNAHSLFNQIKFFEKNKNKIKEYGLANQKIFTKNLSNADLAANKLKFFLNKNQIKF
jgi:glycosyltransferase involved in cell wall biosynthesis